MSKGHVANVKRSCSYPRWPKTDDLENPMLEGCLVFGNVWGPHESSEVWIKYVYSFVHLFIYLFIISRGLGYYRGY